MDRRRYTREFKIEAVKLVRGGLPFDQVLGLQAQEPSWATNGLPPNYLPQANIDGIRCMMPTCLTMRLPKPTVPCAPLAPRITRNHARGPILDSAP
jgi:hypothetical protein